jgi:hypothetical protein
MAPQESTNTATMTCGTRAAAATVCVAIIQGQSCGTAAGCTDPPSSVQLPDEREQRVFPPPAKRVTAEFGRRESNCTPALRCFAQTTRPVVSFRLNVRRIQSPARRKPAAVCSMHPSGEMSYANPCSRRCPTVHATAARHSKRWVLRRSTGRAPRHYSRQLGRAWLNRGKLLTFFSTGHRDPKTKTPVVEVCDNLIDWHLDEVAWALCHRAY